MKNQTQTLTPALSQRMGEGDQPSPATPAASPSPGGEGRGEGETTTMHTKTITILKDGHIHDGRELKTGETLTVDSHLADFLIAAGKAEVRGQKSEVRSRKPDNLTT